MRILYSHAKVTLQYVRNIRYLLCRIEETWRLWRKFQDDYSQFEDWLDVAEHTAAEPESSDVLYTAAKEELKKYEVRFSVETSVETCSAYRYRVMFSMRQDSSEFKINE